MEESSLDHIGEEITFQTIYFFKNVKINQRGLKNKTFRFKESLQQNSIFGISFSLKQMAQLTKLEGQKSIQVTSFAKGIKSREFNIVTKWKRDHLARKVGRGRATCSARTAAYRVRDDRQ